MGVQMSSENESLGDIYARLTQQQAASQESARVRCARMIRRHQFDHVRVWFDGAGDNGAISSMEAVKADQTRTIDIPEEARNAFEEVVFTCLPSGWEINDGSSGEVVIKRDGRVRGQIGWNVTSVEYENIGEGLPEGTSE